MQDMRELPPLSTVKSTGASNQHSEVSCGNYALSCPQIINSVSPDCWIGAPMAISKQSIN
jgi:hypothetical protein